MTVRALSLAFIALWFGLGAYFALQGVAMKLGTISNPGTGFMPFSNRPCSHRLLHPLGSPVVDLAAPDRSERLPIGRLRDPAIVVVAMIAYCTRPGACRLHRQHGSPDSAAGAFRRPDDVRARRAPRHPGGSVLPRGLRRVARGPVAMTQIDALIYGFGVAFQFQNSAAVSCRLRRSARWSASFPASDRPGHLRCCCR